MLQPDPERRSAFPTDYRHVDEQVKAAEDRLRQLDAEMQHGHSVPRPAYRMGGPAEPTRRTRDEIQQEKDTVKDQMYQYVERETEAADVPARQSMRDNSFGRLYREEIDQMNAAEQGLPTPQQGWNMDQRQLEWLNRAKEVRNQQREVQQHDAPDETDQLLERIRDARAPEPQPEP